MKIRFKFKVFAMLLCVIFSLSLQACSSMNSFMLNFVKEDEKADYVMDKADENLSKANSYRCEIDGNFTGKLEGKEFEVSVKTTEIIVNPETDKLIHRTQTEQVLSYDNGSQTTVETLSEGYENGKMFLTSEANEKKQRIWSEISAKEYTKYMENSSDSSFPDEEDAATKIYRKEEDGSITLIYKDFSKEELEAFEADISGILAFFGDGCDLADLELTVSITDDFYPETVSLDIRFKGAADAEDIPVFTMKAEYRDINKAQAPDPINLTEFKQVGDIRYLHKFDDKYTELSNSNEGEFVLEIESEVTSAARIQRNHEYESVNFKRYDGNCKYTISTQIDGKKYEIRYANGEERVYLIKEKSGFMLEDTYEMLSTTKKSQKEAEAYLRSLLNPMSFSKKDVVDITVSENVENLVIFELDTVSNESFELVAQQLNGTLVSASYTVAVEFEKDNLSEVETVVSLTVSTSEGEIKVNQLYRQTF